jgi:hypothetical protein
LLYPAHCRQYNSKSFFIFQTFIAISILLTQTNIHRVRSGPAVTDRQQVQRQPHWMRQ